MYLFAKLAGLGAIGLAGLNLAHQDPTLNTQIAFPKQKMALQQGQAGDEGAKVGQTLPPLSTPATPQVQGGGFAVDPAVQSGFAGVDQARSYLLSMENDLNGLKGEEFDRKVSISMEGVGLKEILTWMKSQDVSFVVDAASIPTDRKITINLINKPIRVVLQAIADATDGFWQNREGVLIYKKAGFGGFGSRFQAPAMVLPPNGGAGSMLSVPVPPTQPKSGSKSKSGGKSGSGGSARTFTIPEVRVITPNDDPKKWEQFQKDMRKMEEDLRIKSLDLEKSLNGRFRMVEPRTFNFRFNDGQGPLVRLAPGRSLGVDALPNVEKFKNSLSKQQKESHAKRGYLLLSELSSDQRKMLGLSSVNGNVTMELKSGSDSFKIRSK